MLIVLLVRSGAWPALHTKKSGDEYKEKRFAKLIYKAFLVEVVWAGIEPATQGFSVLCSTN